MIIPSKFTANSNLVYRSVIIAVFAFKPGDKILKPFKVSLFYTRAVHAC